MIDHALSTQVTIPAAVPVLHTLSLTRIVIPERLRECSVESDAAREVRKPARISASFGAMAVPHHHLSVVLGPLVGAVATDDLVGIWW